MPQTSLSLLERVRRDSDAPSWARLLGIYEPLLSYWLRSQGLQDSDVHDVVQDILVIVCQELPEFQHNGRAGAFRNWLRQVMINCLRGATGGANSGGRAELPQLWSKSWRTRAAAWAAPGNVSTTSSSSAGSRR